jgi:Lysylphosphatidylglycerol synthase TM region
MAWQGLVAALPSAAGRSRRGDMVAPLLVGALVNSVGVARAGDVVKVALARRVLTRRGADVPHADIAGAMMAEHVVAMVAWGALICGIAALAPVPAAVWAAASAMGLACAAVLVGTAVRAPAGAGCRVGCGTALWQRALRAVGRAWAAVHHSHRGLGRPSVAACVGLAALGQWAFAWLAIAAVLAGLGLEHVGLAGAGVILASVTLAHALPITPGGVGIIQIGAMLP